MYKQESHRAAWTGVWLGSVPSILSFRNLSKPCGMTTASYDSTNVNVLHVIHLTKPESLLSCVVRRRKLLHPAPSALAVIAEWTLRQSSPHWFSFIAAVNQLYKTALTISSVPFRVKSWRWETIRMGRDQDYVVSRFPRYFWGLKAFSGSQCGLHKHSNGEVSLLVPSLPLR